MPITKEANVNLKEARKAARYRQEDAANHLGISRQTYIRMENDPGSISVDDAKSLADLFEVSVDDIFFGTDCNETDSHCIDYTS